MPISEGSRTYFAIKKEATLNTEESGSGGKILRRATGSLELVKTEVTSNEKRADFQEQNVNHGTRSVNWEVRTELFGGDYKEFLQSLCLRDFAPVSQITGDFSIAGGVLTRAAGDFVADGLRVGHVVRLGGMGVTANNSRNLRVTAVTATTATLLAIDGGDPVADDAGPNAAATMDLPGQTTFYPETAQTFDTYTIERYDSATETSLVARGNKVGSASFSVTPDNPIDLTFGGLGIDARYVGAPSAPVLTTPTAAGNGPAMSAGIGFARVGTQVVGVITSLSLDVNNGLSNSSVAFANTSPEVYYGRVATITGSLVVLREGIALSSIYDQEQEVSLEFFVEAPGIDPKAFVSIYIARAKLNSDSESDPDGPIENTFTFRALRPDVQIGRERTVLMIQDSSIT